MDWAKWAMGIVAVLICAAVIAVWKLIGEKPSRKELSSTVEDWAKEVVKLDTDIKMVNGRIDRFTELIAGSVSKTDLIEKMGSASTRSDDKDVRVQRDITELKGDLKAMAEKIAMVDKKLDELPSRVASLETTRIQNQAK